MFQHILVPLDGTKEAELALLFAARIARVSGATLTLLSVISERVAVPVGAGQGSRETMDAEKQGESHYLARLCIDPALDGIKVESKLYASAEVGAIEEGIAAVPVDLIVLCRRERSDAESSRLERIIQAVSLDRAVPLLLLHEHEIKQLVKGNASHPFRILVVLDGSKRAEEAIQPAAMLSAMLSAPEPASLHLLGIVCPRVTAMNIHTGKITRQTNEEAWEAARTHLRDISRKLYREVVCNVPLRMSSSLCPGQDMPEVLTAVAMLEQTLTSPALSALALNTNGQISITHWLLGRITKQILEPTHLPILLVNRLEEEVCSN